MEEHILFQGSLTSGWHNGWSSALDMVDSFGCCCKIFAARFVSFRTQHKAFVFSISAEICIDHVEFREQNNLVLVSWTVALGSGVSMGSTPAPEVLLGFPYACGLGLRCN